MNILKNQHEIRESNGAALKLLGKLANEQERKQKHERARSIPTVNCESWTIVRPATEADNRRAKCRIVNRIKNAFWL